MEDGRLKVTDESVEAESGGSGSMSDQPCSLGGGNSSVLVMARETW